MIPEIFEEQPQPINPRDINRRKLRESNPLEYVMGVVTVNSGTIRAANPDDIVQLLMYDLLMLDETWELGEEGLLVPKELYGLSFDAWSSVVGDVRPYTVAQMVRPEFRATLEKARRAELVIHYTDKPHEHYEALTYSNTLFLGPVPDGFDREPLPVPEDARVYTSYRHLIRPDLRRKVRLTEKSFLEMAERAATVRLIQ